MDFCDACRIHYACLPDGHYPVPRSDFSNHPQHVSRTAGSCFATQLKPEVGVLSNQSAVYAILNQMYQARVDQGMLPVMQLCVR